ncbi:hypothetical protein MIMGU_mgv1a017557mg [Erythranthe guttata]|uniref:Uncharacterized protein n=1 Tax=Erythranthe guttata TaxID=4155 RepID=A0A022S1W2_ERYGU|nr:hypothetical protein MIMGU_mgv1a017557mg [Erythranthe guttata]
MWIVNALVVTQCRRKRNWTRILPSYQRSTYLTCLRIFLPNLTGETFVMSRLVCKRWLLSIIYIYMFT